MAYLYFSDLLRIAGLDPKKVKLIRHPLSDKTAKDYYDKGKILEYTRHQKSGFSTGYDYWCVFIGDRGTLAKFFACYKVGESVPDTPDIAPADDPHPEHFTGNAAYFDLQPIDFFKEYENKLIIDWGSSARMWHQKGTTEKPIITIQADEKKVFSGFDKLILTFDELKEIIENQATTYESWKVALSSVNAIYLIVDKATGTQYVGSAYSNNHGLWGRWSSYIATSGHGGNKEMMTVMNENPERCHDLQFSVLQILPKTVTSDEVSRTESLWKEKLLTKKFGWNDN